MYTLQHSYVTTTPTADAAYWEGWAVKVGNLADGRTLLKTTRTGDDARSDARYLRDRLGSGLHWAEIMWDAGHVLGGTPSSVCRALADGADALERLVDGDEGDA
jgi:hypothetical protein